MGKSDFKITQASPLSMRWAGFEGAFQDRLSPNTLASAEINLHGVTVSASVIEGGHLITMSYAGIVWNELVSAAIPDALESFAPCKEGTQSQTKPWTGAFYAFSMHVDSWLAHRQQSGIDYFREQADNAQQVGECGLVWEYPIGDMLIVPRTMIIARRDPLVKDQILIRTFHTSPGEGIAHTLTTFGKL